VQLPERQYPGIVVQGDSFHSIITTLETALAESEDREFIITELLERLRSIQNGYENALGAAGIDLPYYKG
jgi:hypothetical protein